MQFDCVVVGSGNAGSSAALSAVDAGCRKVLLIDRCPQEWVGGNGFFTAGAYRTVHGGLLDLLPIVTNVTPEIASKVDMEPYTDVQFTDDIMRLGNGRNDSALVKSLVDHSREAIGWLAERVNMPFILSFHRQAYEVNGMQKFWGGMVLAVKDGGKGVIAAYQSALQDAGVTIWFNTDAVELVKTDGAVSHLFVIKDGHRIMLETTTVILAAGGFESSAQLRQKHLGPGWENAKIRGTPYNTGDAFIVAQRAGARLQGDWEGCHSTCWDANASSDTGDRVLSNQFTKSGYPLGIMVNAKGDRFVDEGLDFRNYTYAKFGREIMKQPGGYAFQIYDSKAIKWLREEEYGDGIVEKIWGDTVEDLATVLVSKGLEDKENFISTVQQFNLAVEEFSKDPNQIKWDPSVKDGLSTPSLSLPKSNWALSIKQAPFLAVKVTTGITFTFGGIAIDPKTAGVLSEETGEPIKGLFCTGEMVGGLFYSNYPGGSGLTAGTVFGRMAGSSAAALCRQVDPGA